MLLRILFVVTISFYAACSSSKKAMAPTALSDGYEGMTGLDVTAKSDCLTCHSVSEKGIGPSYISIANKYDSNAINIDKLAKKLINGGSGSWGNIPMTPHSSMSDETAKSVIKFILSLKK